jgi:selenocysteine lyase/cysteine desulfurase
MHDRHEIPPDLALAEEANSSAGAGAVAAGAFAPASILRLLAAAPGTPEAIARDERYWQQVRGAYALDDALINLESGGGSPSPRIVLDALKRRLDYSNTIPAVAMWRILEPQREVVRQRLARQWGVDSEEIAITRSASEGLQICQCGIDLARGDEVLTTNQDYVRMLWTYEQRARREGIVLRQISIPVPCEDPAEIVERFERAITPRTRVVHMSHVINLTGQVMPVRAVADMVHARGLPLIVDGAHSFAHMVFHIPELHCDYFAASLHKWLGAPHGTGMLYVRRDRIACLWPLTAAPAALQDNIRKFEEISTYEVAHLLGIAEALAFHLALGPERKQARLLYLRDYWMNRLRAQQRIRWNTSQKPGMACGIGNFDIPGVSLQTFNRWLFDEHGIVTHVTEHAEYTGIRVTPNVFTTVGELDRFCDAVETGLREGIGT